MVIGISNLHIKQVLVVVSCEQVADELGIQITIFKKQSHLMLECPVPGKALFRILGQHFFWELYKWELRKLYQMIEIAKTYCEEEVDY